MRHAFAVLVLLITAWVGLPGAAQAHDAPHNAPHDAPHDAPLDAMMAMNGPSDCPDCPMMRASDDQPATQDCHHGAGCAPALPLGLVSFGVHIVGPEAARGLAPDDFALLRSVTLGRDLPPPRI